MSKQVRKDKVVEISCMSIAGGELKLKAGFKYFANVRLDYANISEGELIDLCSEGSSVRVKAQAKLRKNKALLDQKGVIAESAGEVGDRIEEWVVFDVATDFERESGHRSPEKTAKTAYSKMSIEQKAAFVVENMGVSYEEALSMVQK